MIIMAKYSAILEPVTNMLQGVSVDLYKVSEHINSLLILFDNHRNDADNIFQTLFNEAKSMAIDLDIVITHPRTVKKQSLRANYETESCEDYYRVSIFIPYIDSILQSIKERFDKQNDNAFLLQYLHPKFFKKIGEKMYFESIEKIADFYKIDNLQAEAESVLKLGYDQRWPMGDDRLNGICMLSVHREKVNSNKEKFIENALTQFGRESLRRLKFIFNEKE
ncbi:unnamed protein product [Macrosiphum euphorbiae]|uniref:Uncharacterized protein n=1 Tax=Macrosiphum euphorbiae TaxID=13131 RepID=A0AAV0X6H6_9HEMI|nr:unnamed protein product [Macrosiphum euphorbiae]